MSNLPQDSVAQTKCDYPRSGSLDILSRSVLLALVVCALYFGREIFVPIAIAILLSFVLSPPILLLRRWGLNRVASVLVIVFAAVVIAFAVSAVLTRQVSELAVDLPKHQTTITAKIGKLRDAAADNALFEKGAAALKSLGDINPNRPAPLKEPSSAKREETALKKTEEGQRPIPVEVYQPSPGPFTILQTIAGTALSPLETIGIVVIFVVFILLQREDLRDRFIRLAGSGDLQLTTLAMNDAAGRLSRFFLVQTLVNASFGIILAVGLYLIGVPSPILFGTIGFLLRFVPYIGSFIAAGFPIALAAAVDPGWAMALETLVLFLIVEGLIGQVIEPWLYGHNTGISPIAVVISATFWTWLWGPIGLVLSTPLTVCLVVLGRHVEQLNFLDVILGDAPALTPVETFYQRVLVGDASEVADQAEQFLKKNSLIAYYDEVALPALLMAQTDLRRDVLDESRQLRVKDTIAEVIEDLSDHVDEQPAADSAEPEPYALRRSDGASGPNPETPPGILRSEVAPGAPDQKPVLCIAGRGPLDEAAAALFAQIIEKHGIGAKIEPAGALTVGRISHISGEGARIACLSYLDADVSLASARYAIRRLRRRLPGVKILAGFWQSDPAKIGNICTETKADCCATRLVEAVTFCVKEAQVARPAIGSAISTSAAVLPIRPIANGTPR
jgi:predicted PurR-regulated permease PerM